MRAVANHVMASLLLLQAVFGICCYSVKSHDCNEAVVGSTAVHLSCCDRCRSVPADATTPPEHGDKATTCHGFCTYVKAETVSLDGCHEALLALNVPSIGVRQPGVIGAEPRRPADLLEPSPPVRLHMLYQIILI